MAPEREAGAGLDAPTTLDSVSDAVTIEPATTKYVNVMERVSHMPSVIVAVTAYVPTAGVDGKTRLAPAIPSAPVALTKGFGFPDASQLTDTPPIGVPRALLTSTAEQHNWRAWLAFVVVLSTEAFTVVAAASTWNVTVTLLVAVTVKVQLNEPLASVGGGANVHVPGPATLATRLSGFAVTEMLIAVPTG